MTPETAQVSMSIFGMFAEADLFVKSIIIGLILASVWSWAIIFDKVSLFKRMRKNMSAFEEKFWSGGNLETLYTAYSKSPNDPLSAIFVAAMKELKRAAGDKKSTHLNITERVDKVMQITIDKQVERLGTKMTFLASCGSVSPFVGLFGTVWGIMNTFRAIGVTQSANIATVAPGIAEALLATAFGLIAAIPALVAYNKFSNDANQIEKRMETFADEFGAILARQTEG